MVTEPAMLALRRIRCGLLLAALATAALLIQGGAAGLVRQVDGAAAGFAFAAVIAAILCDRAVRARAMAATADPAVQARDALAEFAYLGAIAYGWGAVAMQGLYLTPLTGLKWQHGWQYASVMALLCAGSLAYIRAVRSKQAAPDAARSDAVSSLAAPLAVGQGLVAGIGLIVLVASGKLASVRADWAANRVFVALAVAILAVAVATLAGRTRIRARE